MHLLMVYHLGPRLANNIIHPLSYIKLILNFVIKYVILTMQKWHNYKTLHSETIHGLTEGEGGLSY